MDEKLLRRFLLDQKTTENEIMIIIFTNTALKSCVGFLRLRINMAYDKLLSEISKWGDHNFFYNERYFWWHGFSGFNGDDWIRKNLEKDEFKMPTSHIDVKTGKEVHEVSVISFKTNLIIKLKKLFDEFEKNLQRELIHLEKENQRQQLLILIDRQLGEIKDSFESQDIPILYHSAILEVFNMQQEKLQERIKVDSKPTASWKFEYVYKNKKNAREEIGLLIDDLVGNNWIDADSKNKQNLNRFLRNGRSKHKIIWIGKRSILKAFIEYLVKSNYFIVKNHWVAIEECFLVYNNQNVLVKASGIRTTKRTTNKKAINSIVGIVSNLGD